jgi:hypothetical protein
MGFYIKVGVNWDIIDSSPVDRGNAPGLAQNALATAHLKFNSVNSLILKIRVQDKRKGRSMAYKIPPFVGMTWRNVPI